MADMTAAEAAEALGVTPRQVARLTAEGRIQSARRVGRTLVLDAESVRRLAQQRRRRGRPWTERIAWATLMILSGSDVAWITPPERVRLTHRLRKAEADDLAYLTSQRAQVQRFRCHPSALDELSSHIVRSGTSALTEADLRRLGLTRAADRLDGYIPSDALGPIIDGFGLSADLTGNVILRTVATEDAFADGQTPRAAIALDLAESLDTRDHAAGLRDLTTLLGDLSHRER
ncbi:helix-turn-helix domain-containing protein [Nocardia sp. NPDC051052]|uniref:helix-turn-helix domain-containing protein n=1 Tax=Nocardia sp. NPDC051052 TaxID=3364322 RepID=UPI0037B12469